MATYSVNDIIGHSLIAKKNLVAHWDYPTKKDMFNVYTGNDAGAPISYVLDASKNLWWQFAIIDNITRKERNYYIMQQEGAFDEQALKDQGVLTAAEKLLEKEKNDNPFAYYFGKISAGVKKYGIPAFFVVVGAGVVKEIVKSKK